MIEKRWLVIWHKDLGWRDQTFSSEEEVQREIEQSAKLAASNKHPIATEQKIRSAQVFELDFEEIARLQQWKDAVQDAVICNHLGGLLDPALTPREVLHKLIYWEIQTSRELPKLNEELFKWQVEDLKKAFSRIYDSVTDIMTQKEIDAVEILHKDDLAKFLI
jgi:hypothetical protein